MVAALVRTDPATRAAYGGGPATEVEVGPDALAAAKLAAPRVELDRYPVRPLSRADADRDRRVLCVSLSPRPDGAGPVEVSAVDALPAGVGAAAPRPTRGDRADHVAVRPGTVALVREEPHPGVASGTAFLVTDTGRRHAVADADALRALGYGEVAVPRVAKGLLMLLPSGPELSRAAAARPADEAPTG
jgi:hypothetical protein